MSRASRYRQRREEGRITLYVEVDEVEVEHALTCISEITEVLRFKENTRADLQRGFQKFVDMILRATRHNPLD